MKVWFSSKRRPTVRHSTYMRIVDAEERQQWKKVIESPSSIHSIISRQYITPPSAIEDEMTLLWSQDILLGYALLHVWHSRCDDDDGGCLLLWWNLFQFFSSSLRMYTDMGFWRYIAWPFTILKNDNITISWDFFRLTAPRRPVMAAGAFSLRKSHDIVMT